MKSPYRSPAIRRAIAKAEGLGYRVEFVEFCQTKGRGSPLPPFGMCDREASVIQISKFLADRMPEEIRRRAVAAAISHEIEHAEGKDRATDFPELGLRCGGSI